MNLLHVILLNKEFNEVPSRSERAHVLVAKLDGDNPYFIVQYSHHEGTNFIVGDETSILEDINTNFEDFDRQDYPGIDAMLKEIANTITKVI